MKKLVLTILVLVGIIGCSSDSKSSTAPATEVVIGTQTWKIKNLNVSTYRNGDPIPEVQDPTAWEALTTGAWCYYNNDPVNAAIYGKLYNWYAVNDPRGLAPSGWHVPSHDEWTTLINHLGYATVAGGKMKSTSGWYPPNTDATNSSGFSGFPGGTRQIGEFKTQGELGLWWSSTKDGISVWYQSLKYDLGSSISYYNLRREGCSVRCVKD